mgnify:FL=1
MDIGVIGMAVMGSNLALNMADHGFKVAGYNRSKDMTERVIKEHPHENMKGFFDFKEFVQSLKRPRRVMLMIKAGKPVDMVIDQLIPELSEGDIIIDGGNSFFQDTRRRSKMLAEKGIHYFGVGVSGGEKGARRGPSIMPGGNKDAYRFIQPILEAIAAPVGEDTCCTYIGSDGAGHYVKMVHNGIEYADMQLIAESYLLLKYVGGLANEQLAEVYHKWNEGELKSYLIGITADIFKENDEAGGQLVDKIVDSAGQKGTGRWTSIAALEQGVNVSMITAACNARVMSNLLESRAEASKLFPVPKVATSVPDDLVEMVRQSLYTAKIMAYAQGFSLYRSASETYGWDLDYGRIASIFRAGCIIQAEFLNKITEAYQKNPQLQNLMLDDFFMGKINANQSSLRRVLALAAERGIPVPAMANALQYLDAYRSTCGGANLIQAQRDYFGAHTYRRIDKEGDFHHEWKENYQK